MEDKQVNEIVAPNIIRILKEKGFKQCEIAEKAGYSKQQFSDMLNGRKVIRDFDIANIANALDVTANDLFRSEGG